jgi:hypothetical protein
MWLYLPTYLPTHLPTCPTSTDPAPTSTQLAYFNRDGVLTADIPDHASCLFHLHRAAASECLHNYQRRNRGRAGRTAARGPWCATPPGAAAATRASTSTATATSTSALRIEDVSQGEVCEEGAEGPAPWSEVPTRTPILLL